MLIPFVNCVKASERLNQFLFVFTDFIISSSTQPHSTYQMDLKLLFGRRRSREAKSQQFTVPLPWPSCQRNQEDVGRSTDRSIEIITKKCVDDA